MSTLFERLDLIRDSVTAQASQDRVPFTELRAGDSIRHAGEDGWVIYLICHERGWMRLSHPDHGTEYVPDNHPESLWQRGAF